MYVTSYVYVTPKSLRVRYSLPSSLLFYLTPSPSPFFFLLLPPCLFNYNDGQTVKGYYYRGHVLVPRSVGPSVGRLGFMSGRPRFKRPLTDRPRPHSSPPPDYRMRNTLATPCHSTLCCIVGYLVAKIACASSLWGASNRWFYAETW